MLKFGVIAEGPTDQTVIENILLGYFEDQEDEPDIRYIQPPRPLTETPAGWGLVFKSLERKDHEGALQYNDYLVIHIDTDVQEETGFDVPRREKGRQLSVSDRVDRVITRLKQDIDTGFYYAGMEEGHKYQPDAPAREKPADPRWRVGLVSARARIFLAGVIPGQRTANSVRNRGRYDRVLAPSTALR